MKSLGSLLVRRWELDPVRTSALCTALDRHALQKCNSSVSQLEVMRGVIFPSQSHIPSVSRLQLTTFLYFSNSTQSLLTSLFSSITMISFKPLFITCALGALDLLPLCLAETTTASVSTSAAIATTRSKVFDVNVGNDEGALIFEPDTIVASTGDLVNFHFYPFNHSVAQSSFEKPCQPLSGGVGQSPLFSGFFPVKSGEAVSCTNALVVGGAACANHMPSAL